MAFYPSILPWYDQIFPFSTDQRDFVLSFGYDSHLAVVDVGCGTGSLIVSLAEVFRKTAGLEPDAAMLETARGKAAIKPVATLFINAGMLDLKREIAPGSVDRLICFGNTLPHLANEEEVAEFIRQVSVILKPNGFLLIQLINYDRILDQNLPGLPSIENEELKFDRIYQYQENASHVNFVTKLLLKTSGIVVENEVPLLAIRPVNLRRILVENGFAGLEEFGGFKKSAFLPESQPYIVKARLGV